MQTGVNQVFAALSLLMLLLAASCGGDATRPATALVVQIDRGLSQSASYRLECDPVGGPAPRAAALCAAAQRHRVEMLVPGPVEDTCFGGEIPVDVHVTGTSDEASIDFRRRSCDWPGGAGAAVWEAATRSEREFRFSLGYLACVDRTGTTGKAARAAAMPCIERLKKR
ncbi:MAG: hypothetical protein ABR521_04725 [Gaiellaceae bacterium]